jgi:hypothetical protein
MIAASPSWRSTTAMRRWSARRRIVSPGGEAGEAPLRAFVPRRPRLVLARRARPRSRGARRDDRATLLRPCLRGPDAFSKPRGSPPRPLAWPPPTQYERRPPWAIREGRGFRARDGLIGWFAAALACAHLASLAEEGCCGMGQTKRRRQCEELRIASELCLAQSSLSVRLRRPRMSGSGRFRPTLR